MMTKDRKTYWDERCANILADDFERRVAKLVSTPARKAAIGCLVGGLGLAAFLGILHALGLTSHLKII